LANPKNQQVIAAAAVRISKDGGAELLVQAPTGVVIAPGVKLSVDGQETAKAPFTACAPRACEAIFKIDQNLINSLAKGKALAATVETLRGKSANIEFQLDGFVKAYAAFKKGVTN
jgi:invasion protein IalB